MILITEIKTAIVDKNEVEIAHYENKPYIIGVSDNRLEPIQMEVYYEYVRGEKFINARGEEVCLGMTAQVQEVLGLPIKIFNDFQRKNKELEDALYDMVQKKLTTNNELRKYKTMKFIDRLKFLFGIVK